MSQGWSAKITGVAELAPELRAAVDEGTQAGLEALGIKGAELVQDNIVTPYNGKPAAVCFGNLAHSIASVYAREPDRQTIVIGVTPTLGASAYAAPVETGARPHMPPVSALVPWVQKKFGIEDEKSALSMAFAVAYSIRKKGTRGQQMFSRALDSLEPMVPGAFEKNIAIAFARHGFTPLESSI